MGIGRFTVSDILFGGLVQLVTLPYHRFFTYNTLRPAQEIERLARTGGSITQRDDTPGREALYTVLVGWRARKKDELSFVALAATVLTAIVTASFSWPNVGGSYWVGPAFWYASLSTSICGIFLSAQQLSMLSLIGELPAGGYEMMSARMLERHLNQMLAHRKKQGLRRLVRETAAAEEEEEGRGGEAQNEGKEWTLCWRLVFTWQCPMMFIAYATLFYIIGLTVVVCTPLIWEDFGPNSYIAVAYIATMGLTWGLFAFCSLGGYNAISLREEGDESPSEESGPGSCNDRGAERGQRDGKTQ
ncbi:hypothetical protein QBC46DRAFT_312694 [Diplogelasinospora grovesii]|uniref:Uncharacterized protein n=1 Tax=Diplogelasinospora grovesii TaxID=303347 RepID=A0AAN6N954_9PEZI|nr:hypothetical protein QBC46DRAFT_312694 [Diplogelasinospora grovesii]